MRASQAYLLLAKRPNEVLLLNVPWPHSAVRDPADADDDARILRAAHPAMHDVAIGTSTRASVIHDCPPEIRQRKDALQNMLERGA